MIDERIIRPWPEEIGATTAPLRQGHLFANPPFLYLGDPRYPLWEATAALRDEEGPDVVFLPESDGPPFGIVVTQSCDLDESERKEPRMPWLQISPVYSFDPNKIDEQFRRDLDNHARLDLAKLNPPELDPRLYWVADLRIDVPVEKGWLVGRPRLEAFAAEAGYEQFGLRLRERVARTAYGPSLSQVLRGLQQKFQILGPNGEVRSGVSQIRARIAPSRLDPEQVQILVVKKAGATNKVEEWFDRWQDGEAPKALEMGLELEPVAYASWETMLARDFDKSDEITFRQQGAN